MKKLNFEEQKETIIRFIRETQWDDSTGLNEAQLLESCKKINEQMYGSSHMAVKAEMFSYILDHARIAVSEHHIFTDCIDCRNVLREIRNKWKNEEYARPETALCLKETEDGCEAFAWYGNLDTSHTSPDWDLLLQKGLCGIVYWLHEEKERHAANGTLTEEMEVFYNGCLTVWKAVIRLIQRYITLIEKLPVTPQSSKALSILRAISTNAPQTTAEAMELMILVYRIQTCVDNTDVRSLGRLDWHLYEFVQSDLKNGCTDEEIDELFQFFFWHFTAINHPNNVPICLGGLPHGINSLSYRILRVYTDLNIYSPKLQIRITPNMPDDFLKASLNNIRNGNSSFVFVNDEIAIKSLIKLGMKCKHAENYVPVGCYELMALGQELPCTSVGKVNLAKIFELALNDGNDPITGRQIGPHSGKAETISDSVSFEKVFYEQMQSAISLMMKRGMLMDRLLGVLNPSPMLSGATEPCVTQGKDIYSGGAMYNLSAYNIIALSNAVDSILAVRHAVFSDHQIKLAQLRDLLHNNWKNGESIRQYIKNFCPKYGNGNAEADELTAEIVRFASGQINNKPNNRNGVCQMGLWSINEIIQFGEHTGATPDGRYAGEPLSKNLCAVTGMDQQGITALVKSVTAIDATDSANGAVIDLMLHPTAVQGESGLSSMLALLKVYCKKGGQCVQFNVLDPETLKKAQKDPEKYATLQVRVCGWNAYFVTLSETEQNTFIAQAEALK